MSSKVSRAIQKNSLWLVLLCHLLLFSGVSFVWISQAQLIKKEERPSLYIPSYVYQAAASSSIQPQNTQRSVPTSKSGTEKPAAMTNMSRMLNVNHPIDISSSKENEPVHLIGDKKIDKPLLTLLGKALTAHLVYPKSAIDFKIKGTAVIGFLLQPDGQVTQVQLLKSSKAEVLDKAALAAANAIAPVRHVAPYLDKPKFMVIGIIFE
jgi:TonB family protein